MENLWVGILGIIATILSSLSLMPQVIRTWRTRSAADISGTWLVVALTACTIWIGYGSLINSVILIVVNAIGFVQAASILFVKLRFKPTAPPTTAAIAENG
jgi:MtN3 and saliva related transmembrane protein